MSEPDVREARFTAVAREVGEPLRRYVVRRVVADAVDDVLADAMLVLWRRLDDVPTDDPLPWAYAVARGCVANARRGERRRLRLVERVAGATVPEPDPEPVDTGGDPELQAALARLGELDREVVRLWAWEGLAPREIAVVIGASANAVSIRLHKAKKRLAAELGAAGPGKKPAASGQESVDGRRPR